MNKDLLAKIARQSKMSEALFDHFRKRDRNPRLGIMDLKRTQLRLRADGVDIIPEEFLANFKALEKAGVGRIVMKEGRPISFRWTANMREVGQVVEPLEEIAPPSGRSTGETSIEVILGEDREATLRLPKDLTKKEAEFLYNTLIRRINR